MGGKVRDQALPDEVAEDDGLDHGPPREVAHAEAGHYLPLHTAAASRASNLEERAGVEEKGVETGADRNGEEAKDGARRAEAHCRRREQEQARKVRAYLERQAVRLAAQLGERAAQEIIMSVTESFGRLAHPANHVSKQQSESSKLFFY